MFTYFLPFDPKTPTNISNTSQTEPTLNFRMLDIMQIDRLAEACLPNQNGCKIIQFDPNSIGSGEPGSMGFKTMLHELEHSGLGADDITIKRENDSSVAAIDNLDYTVMSYNSSTRGVFPETPMVADIAFAQKQFGHPLQTPDKSPVMLTGERPKLWTLWNPHPTTLDASEYKGPSRVVINTNNGVVLNPTQVEEETVFNAYGTCVTTGIGAPNAVNAFIGNDDGGSTFIGGKGKKDNHYELSGSNNFVVAGNGANSYLLHAGSQTTIQGYKPGESILAGEEDTKEAVAKRENGSISLNISSGKGNATEVTLKDYMGPTSEINLINPVILGETRKIKIIDTGNSALTVQEKLPKKVPLISGGQDHSDDEFPNHGLTNKPKNLEQRSVCP